MRAPARERTPGRGPSKGGSRRDGVGSIRPRMIPPRAVALVPRGVVVIPPPGSRPRESRRLRQGHPAAAHGAGVPQARAG